MQNAQAEMLPDGRRLHLHHGPIDLIIEAFGEVCEVKGAYSQAEARFASILEELVEELPVLRRPLEASLPTFRGKVAQAMCKASAPHRSGFVTPMIAVAGAVADEILAALVADRQLERAYVNNGGDVALHLPPGSQLTTALFGTDAQVTLRADAAPRGLATSGWRGRSWSMGIADSVTVLAENAAIADAAATLIANAVDLPGHDAIKRAPASALDPDCELGERLVTVGVEPLTRGEARAALYGGRVAAEALLQRNIIFGAALFLEGEAAFCPAGLFEPALGSARAGERKQGNSGNAQQRYGAGGGYHQIIAADFPQQRADEGGDGIAGKVG